MLSHETFADLVRLAWLIVGLALLLAGSFMLSGLAGVLLALGIVMVTWVGPSLISGD